MPSLHAADALIVGLVLFSRLPHALREVLWLLWPGWVWFSVMATGNHFWLDVVAGRDRRDRGASSTATVRRRGDPDRLAAQTAVADCAQARPKRLRRA